MSEREPLSIQQQAELVEGIIARCAMHGGAVAGESTLIIEKEVVDDLVAISSRLRRMAPFEDKIRKMVLGR